MEGLLPRSVVDSIRRTAKGLNGFPRRVFQAVVTKEYVEGKLRKAERCLVGIAMPLLSTSGSKSPSNQEGSSNRCNL